MVISCPEYVVAIRMMGDIGARTHADMTVFYRRSPFVKLEAATASQDFTALQGSKPTTFQTEEGAKAVADRVRVVCDRLHKTLAACHDINRTFEVSVQPYTE